MQRSMNKPGLMVAVAAALVVLAAMVLSLVPEPEPLPAAPEILDTAAHQPAAPDETPPEPARPRRLQRAAPEVDWVTGGVHAGRDVLRPGKPAYRGHLVLGDVTRPLKGVTLRLTHAWLDTALPEAEEDTSAARASESPLLAWRGTTNQYGFFEIPFAPQDRDLFLRIDPDGPANDVLLLQRMTWRDETIDLGTITLEERGAVRGRITGGQRLRDARVRALDLPLSNAWVGEGQRITAQRGATAIERGRSWVTARGVATIPRWLHRRDRILPFPETRSDGAGRFHLPSVRPGVVQLTVQTTDGVDLVREITVEPGRTTEVEFDARTDLAQLVVEDRGHERPEVAVLVAPARRVTAPHAGLPRRTQDGVVWANAHALANGSVFVRRHAGWPWEAYRARPSGQNYAVKLHPLQPLNVRVRDLAGRPVDDAQVTLLANAAVPDHVGSTLAPSLQPTRLEPSLWRQDALPPGTYRVLARAGGFAPALTEIRVSASPVRGSEAELDLFPTFELLVRVVNGTGQPVAGAQVTVLPHNGDPRHAKKSGTRWRDLVPRDVRLGTTNEAGELRAGGFWDNSFSLEAKHPAHGRGLVRVSRPRADRAVEVRLTKMGTLLGTLTERGVAPVETLLVRPRPSAELEKQLEMNLLHRPASVRVDEDGRFTLRGLHPGKWHLEVRRPHEPQAPPPAAPRGLGRRRRHRPRASRATAARRPPGRRSRARAPERDRGRRTRRGPALPSRARRRRHRRAPDQGDGPRAADEDSRQNRRELVPQSAAAPGAATVPRGGATRSERSLQVPRRTASQTVVVDPAQPRRHRRGSGDAGAAQGPQATRRVRLDHSNRQPARARADRRRTLPQPTAAGLTGCRAGARLLRGFGCRR